MTVLSGTSTLGSRLIGRLLPPHVEAVEAFADVDDGSRFPAEEAAIARAVEKRRREFVTVRACARQALARLGHPPVPIVPGPQRAPTWPAGVVGSLTHCDGYRAAAVARAGDLVTIGIDAEPDAPLPSGVLASITLPPEHADIARLRARDERVHWDRLLFSAKESVYKAWFPLTGRWLGFEQAALSFDPADGTFEARLILPPADAPAHAGGDGTAVPRRFSGRWPAQDGLVLTAVVVTRDPPPP